MEKRTVILYGQSMLLSLVAGNLSRSPNLNINNEANWEEVAACAAKFAPDVLIYEMPCASESSILQLLNKYPRLLLIGLDLETNRAVLIAGQEAHSFTMDHIRAIVEGGELENNPR
jgi:hypothetical protein